MKVNWVKCKRCQLIPYAIHITPYTWCCIYQFVTSQWCEHSNHFKTIVVVSSNTLIDAYDRHWRNNPKPLKRSIDISRSVCWMVIYTETQPNNVVYMHTRPHLSCTLWHHSHVFQSKFPLTKVLLIYTCALWSGFGMMKKIYTQLK